MSRIESVPSYVGSPKYDRGLIRPEIPVIICTCFCDENDEKRSMDLGVKGFLKKPVATGDLAEMVRKVLDEFAGYCAAKYKGFYPS